MGGIAQLLCHLCNGSKRRNGGDHGGGGRDSLAGIDVDFLVDLAVEGLLGAVAGDVTGFAALVAGLAGGVEGTAVGSSAVARDVTELAAGVALHRLCLAVASKVVRSTALVASRRARAAGESTTAEAKAAAPDGSAATAHADAGRVRASTLASC